jgi:hypothetical protein
MIKINKQMNNKYIFTPEWISGFTQADGSFTVSFEKREKGILYRPNPIFSLSQTNVEWDMFVSLQKYLGIGSVYKNRNGVVFVVKSIKDILTVVVPMFDSVPLRGGKLESYLKFRKVVLLMQDKKHLTIEGLLQIIDLTYFMNKETTMRNHDTRLKLLNELEFKYGKLPSVDSIFIDEVPAMQIKPSANLRWQNKEFIRGLIDGDGSFNVSFRTKVRRIGVNFTVVHETSSISVLYDLVSFFKCGSVYKLPSEAARYQVQSLNDILKFIIPLFKDIKFNTRKQKNFEIIMNVCSILEEKGNGKRLDDENLLKIIELAWNMNVLSLTRKITKEEYISKFIGIASTSPAIWLRTSRITNNPFHYYKLS